ncbi:MAG: pectate lyase, partial [Fuerstiella sp.]|nr:pectate lyase [Fuerstiella sp.]
MATTRCFMMVFVLSPAFASAMEYYVATSGSDANAGTIEQPFASVQRAQDSVEPGDTVFIRGGTYRMQESDIARRERIWAHAIRLNRSGRNGERINYWAYENEQPVFDFSAVKPPHLRVHA